MPKQRLTYMVYFGPEQEAYVCEVDAMYHIDHAFGADADGKRGTCRTIIDDVHLVEVVDGNQQYMNLLALPPGLKEKIIQAVDEHL